MMLWHWLLNVTGIHIPSGGSLWYNFWSGFGSDLGELALLASVITWYRLHECHVDGCYRFGKHPFQHYKLCKRHHPEVPDKLTHLRVKKLHKASLDKYET